MSLNIARLKRCAPKCLLKASEDGTCRRVNGRPFHRVGAATGNALSLPESWSLVHKATTAATRPKGPSRIVWCQHVPWYTQVPHQCIALWVRVSILNWTRCLMGSQRKVRSTGVTWSLTEVRDTMRAATFDTRCSLSSWYAGRPYNKLFRLPSLDVTSSWMATWVFRVYCSSGDGYGFRVGGCAAFSQVSVQVFSSLRETFRLSWSISFSHHQGRI